MVMVSIFSLLLAAPLEGVALRTNPSFLKESSKHLKLDTDAAVSEGSTNPNDKSDFVSPGLKDKYDFFEHGSPTGCKNADCSCTYNTDCGVGYECQTNN